MIAAIDPPGINIVINGNSGMLDPPLPDVPASNTFTVPIMFGCSWQKYGNAPV